MLKIILFVGFDCDDDDWKLFKDISRVRKRTSEISCETQFHIK